MCTADNKIDLQENTSKHYGGTVSMENTEQKKEIQLKVLLYYNKNRSNKVIGRKY